METSLSISSFKRFILRIVLPFGLATAVLMVVGNALFERYIILSNPANGAFKVNRILTENDPQEIPILGNSRAEAHFASSVIHPKCFNYGLSGTHSDVMLFFLRQELKKSRRTPILVNFDLEGLDSAIGNPSNYLLNAGDPDVRALMGPHYSCAYRVPLLKYFNQFDLFFGLWLNNRAQHSSRNDRGAMLRYERIEPATLQANLARRAAGVNTFKGSRLIEAELRALLEAHPERRVVFVVSPYHAGIFQHFPNLDVAMAFLASLDALPHVDVLDFSHVDYPDSLYNNSTHLSYEGAMRFSAELRDSLRVRVGAPF